MMQMCQPYAHFSVSASDFVSNKSNKENVLLKWWFFWGVFLRLVLCVCVFLWVRAQCALAARGRSGTFRESMPAAAFLQMPPLHWDQYVRPWGGDELDLCEQFFIITYVLKIQFFSPTEVQPWIVSVSLFPLAAFRWKNTPCGEIKEMTNAPSFFY